MPGRFIGESVRLTSDLLEYMDYNNLPGYLVSDSNYMISTGNYRLNGPSKIFN